MTQHTSVEKEPTRKKRRRRQLPFPATEFEEALLLPKAIHEHGVGGKIRRLTLFDKLNRSPSSGPSRGLVTNASRYGLTSGSYGATSLAITDSGQIALAVEQSPYKAIETQFQLAIEQFAPFKNLYQKLKDRRVPDDQVLRDEFASLGIEESDRDRAVEIFTANLRFLRLIHKISGIDYVRSIEQVLEQETKEPIRAAEESKEPQRHRFSQWVTYTRRGNYEQ